MADLLVAASKLRRSVLPSMATIWPAVISCRVGDPTQQARLELGRLDRSQNRIEPIVRRDAGFQIEKLRQPLPLLAAVVGDRDEIIGAADHRANGDRDHVDERIDDLAPPRIGQADEMVLNAVETFSGMATSLICRDSRPGNRPADTTNRIALFIPDYPIWRNRPDVCRVQADRPGTCVQLRSHERVRTGPENVRGEAWAVATAPPEWA